MGRLLRHVIAALAVAGGALAPQQPLFAQTKPANVEVPSDKKMTARQLHDHLAKGSGWVRFKTEAGTSNGTAWIIDQDAKLMITNAHVVEGKDVVEMLFPEWKDGKLVREQSVYDHVTGVKATVIDRDESRDLALLLVESIPESSHVLKLADAEPEEGDNVRTIGGFTLGGEGLVWGAVRGEVRTVGPVAAWRGPGKVRKISTDAPINGGNSGGPLVDEAGNVVGVNASYQTNARNVSHHISIVELKAYMKVVGPLAKPTTAEQFLLRGTRRLDYGRSDFAVQDFSAAIKKNDKLAEAYHLRGKAFLRANDANTALDDLNTAMKLDAANYEFHVTRGKCYLALQKSDEAQTDFSAAIRIDPSQGLAYNERGVAHYRAKRYDQAQVDFGRAIEKAKDVPLYYANRADSYNALGKFELCAKDWAAASDLAPWNAEYAVNCGWACINCDKYDACLQAFALAVKIDPTARHSVLLAIGQRLNGDLKNALKSVNDGLAKYGENGPPSELYTAFYNRGMIQTALKNPKSAIDDLNKAVELSGGKNMYPFVERSKAYAAAGLDDEAAADLATAKKLGWKAAGAPKVEAFAPKTAIVGTWKSTFDSKLGKITQELTFKNDGTWAGTTTIVNNVGTEIVQDTGDYQIDGKSIAFQGKITGNVARTFNKFNEKNFEVDITEAGVTATFTKVK